MPEIQYAEVYRVYTAHARNILKCTKVSILSVTQRDTKGLALESVRILHI